MRVLIVLMIQLFMVSSLFAGAYQISDATFTNNGWAKPIHRNLWTNTNYDYDSDEYYRNFRFRHGAVDINAPYDSRVYAIDDGEVVAMKKSYDSTENTSIIYIKHTTSSGKKFLAIYGHTFALSVIYVGKKVTQGEQIGNIRSYGSPDHIHFGIGTNVDSHPTNLWGGIKGGIVNPITFLKNNKNGYTNTKSAIFNGAGSLVAPNDDCYGCNKDIVQLHRENGIGSVGVFQWLYDENTCSQLDIYADEDLGDVVIKTKSWGNDYIHKAFKVNLDAYDVVSIKPDDTWTTFAVITQRSLKSSTAQLIAKCRTSSDTFYNANRVSVSTDPVDVTYGYNWTGTGSLITQSNRADDAFGKYKDLANTRTTNSNKAFTTFQWYAKSGCKQVVVSRSGSNSYVSVNSMSIKKWNQSNAYWKKQNCSSLPCTVSVSSDGYYVLKIATDKNALGGDHMRVKCK